MSERRWQYLERLFREETHKLQKRGYVFASPDGFDVLKLLACGCVTYVIEFLNEEERVRDRERFHREMQISAIANPVSDQIGLYQYTGNDLSPLRVVEAHKQTARRARYDDGFLGDEQRDFEHSRERFWVPAWLKVLDCAYRPSGWLGPAKHPKPRMRFYKAVSACVRDRKLRDSVLAAAALDAWPGDYDPEHLAVRQLFEFLP